MKESKARRIAFFCLIIILVPFGVLVMEYLQVRSDFLAREAVVNQSNAPIAVVEEDATIEEVYVPPEPIRFPLY